MLETPREWAGYLRVDDGAAHDAVLRAAPSRGGTFVDGGFTHQGQFLHDGRLVDFDTRTTIAEVDGTQAYVATWWPFHTGAVRNHQ